ncbi:MAG: dienelactone hydrolase family protein [Lysinibacillus sp.]
MKKKVFLIHEIYGVNTFIKKQAAAYSDSITTVECISLYPNSLAFSYEQANEAYDYFINNVGFEAPIKHLTKLLTEAIREYEEVVVIGFSVGATLAWKLSTLPLYRVVCIYGSRIRQYVNIQPNCHTLVILPSSEKSFDVNDMKQLLDHIPFVQIAQFPGEHGFMDSNNANYNQTSSIHAQSHILRFLQMH